jgi:hypothetical protein
MNIDKKEYQRGQGVNSKKGLQKIIQSGNDGKIDKLLGGKYDVKAQYELMHGKIAPTEIANLYDSWWRHDPYLYNSKDMVFGGDERFDKDKPGFRKNPNYNKPNAKDKEGNVIRNFFGVPIYKEPVQPYILQQEPKLHGKQVTHIDPISTSRMTTPQLRTIENPNVEMSGSVPQGKYRTSYYDPEMKDWNERAFMSQQESDQFANEMSQRGYPGSYGNVTQRMQYAMGGSLPGSVGFTYARTGNIPSNGPYAKKTKASAQDGKTIVQNLNLPKYEEPTGFLTGYGYGMSPQANVNIYEIGAYGEKKVSPRMTLSGNMSSQSVAYPGGSEMFMKPRYDVGMRYRFDNGGSMSYYQHGLDWKPKSISKNGSIIEDDRGQWAHPGKITKINSNQITMKGVDYPVLGISDAGDKQMMYPDQEYTFKGKTVTEYPQKKKNGGWLDKYK